MKIAVNARFLLSGRLEGLGRFSHESLQRIVKDHPEHEFHFYFDRPFSEEFIYADNVIPHIAYPPARHPYLYYLWFEWSLPYLFKKHQADLFLSPDGFISIKADLPSVPVIHDLAFEHYPEFVSKTGSRYYKKNFPRFARHADRIATVSEYTKGDLIKLYNIHPERIDVIYNGASSNFQPSSQKVQKETRFKHSQGLPYFIALGAIQPRKNILGLLEAFEAMKESTDLPHQLLIVGRKAWQNEDLETYFNGMKYGHEVHFVGKVDDKTLQLLLGAATALCFVPFFEGFGLPILEAAQCGTPGVVSNNSSHPEVAGNGALYCDASDPSSITRAMVQMASDEGLRNELAQAAISHAAKFSWEKTAKLLWDSVQKVADENEL